MPENKISAALEQAAIDEILASINTINTDLPFLVDLNAEDKKTLLK